MTNIKHSFGLIALLISLLGCASTPDPPVFFVPANDGPEGYTLKDEQWAFETKLIRLTAKPMRPADLAGEPGAIGILSGKDYIIIRMEIENKSNSKLIFNPAYAAMLTDTSDYYKPLDYTDIYTILSEADEVGAPVRGLRGHIYDLTVTLEPGATTTRLFLFPPVDKDSDSAQLFIKNIYIGKADITVTIPLTKDETKQEEKEKKAGGL